MLLRYGSYPIRSSGSSSIDNWRMPKLRRPPPHGILEHLLKRFREGRISVEDFTELKHWLESDPEVSAGLWYERFKKFTKGEQIT
jgi:hypothetical protein